MGLLLILFVLGWSEGSTDHFLISYHAENRVLANSVVEIVEESYTEVEDRYGFSLNERVRVYLLKDGDEAGRYYGSKIPSWVIAFAVPHQSTIYLISPRVAKSLSDTRKVFVHELAHIFNHQISPQLPLWLNEGLVMWVSGEERLRDNIWLSFAALTNSFLRLRDIDYHFPEERHKSGLAYAESRNSVIYIVEVYGMDGLRRLLSEVHTTGDVDLAFKKSFGVSYERFDDDFLVFLRSRFRWLAILGEGLPFWILLLSLFLVVYVVKRRRTRRRLEALRKEEETFSYPD